MTDRRLAILVLGGLGLALIVGASSIRIFTGGTIDVAESIGFLVLISTLIERLAGREAIGE